MIHDGFPIWTREDDLIADMNMFDYFITCRWTGINPGTSDIDEIEENYISKDPTMQYFDQYAEEDIRYFFPAKYKRIEEQVPQDIKHYYKTNRDAFYLRTIGFSLLYFEITTCYDNKTFSTYP